MTEQTHPSQLEPVLTQLPPSIFCELSCIQN